MNRSVDRRSLLGAAVFALTPAMRALAQEPWPSRTIKIIVGYATGGPSDITARLLAPRLTALLGQPVVVENRPGAGSNIAFEAVATAPPDGYTLMLATVVMTTNPYLYKTRWGVKNFQPIVNCMTSPSVLAVSSALDVRNLKEFVDVMKREPGRHSFASSGAGGSSHLAGELLQRQAGISMIHVPYKGVAPAINDLIAGQVDSGFITAMGSVGHLRKGNLKPLAVAAKKRIPQLPDVPTFAEAGYPEILVESWNGLIAPAGTPVDIVSRLNAEANKILAMPPVRENFIHGGGLPVGGSSLEFSHAIEEEHQRWGALIQAANIKLD